jgi:hypothetical protein
LRDVDDKARQRIESLFVTNSLLRERVLAAEQDLIEEYLEDSLNPADKENFIGQYTHTSAQRRKLRIAKLIKDWAMVERKADAARVSRWSRLRGRLRLKPMFVIPIAMATLAVILGVVWVKQQNATTNRCLATEQEAAELITKLRGNVSLN